MQTLIAEMLGHRHRSPGAAATGKRGLIRSGRHNDRARHPLGAKDMFGEIAQFATAFADQRNNNHIGGNPACEFGQKRRFSNTGASKKPDPLTLHQGQKRVEYRNTS